LKEDLQQQVSLALHTCKGNNIVNYKSGITLRGDTNVKSHPMKKCKTCSSIHVPAFHAGLSMTGAYESKKIDYVLDRFLYFKVD